MAKKQQQETKAPTSQALVKWKEWSEADAEKENFFRGSWFKMREGKNVIRILPARADADHGPFVMIAKHWVQVEGGQRKVSVNCPRTLTRGKRPCVVCEHMDKLARSPRGADQKVADDLRVARRVVCAVIDRNDPESGPLPCELTSRVYDTLRDTRSNPMTKVDFTHPVSGADVCVTKKQVPGKSWPEYGVIVDRALTPLHPDSAVMNEWLQSTPEIRQFAEVPTDSQLRKTLGLDGLDGPGDDFTSPAPPVGTSKTTRRVEDDVEDADVDDLP
jgi:hypothetical protein